MEEVWKDIVGYEGLYQVSNFGRVKNNNKLLKGYIAGRGYIYVVLYKNNIRKHKTIHSLVALHFIENPDNLYTINHKDENKLNNRVDNLEWMSIDNNNKYSLLGGKNSRAVPILQYENNKLIKEWDSVRDAIREYGFGITSNLKNKTQKSYGYYWKYKNTD